jgi:hypothetical protein
MVEKHPVHDALERLVNRSEVEKAVRDPKFGISTPVVRHFQFVVVLADSGASADGDKINALFAALTKTILEHHAAITTSSPSLIVALLGAPFDEPNSPEARRALVDALGRAHGDQIRVVHGEADAPVGLFGGGGLRQAYDVAIPRFAEILTKLVALPPGASAEFDRA